MQVLQENVQILTLIRMHRMLVLSTFTCRKHTFVLRILSSEESAMLVRFFFWCFFPMERK